MRRADSFLSDADSGGEEEVFLEPLRVFFSPPVFSVGIIRRVHELGLVDLDLDQKKEPNINGLAP